MCVYVCHLQQNDLEWFPRLKTLSLATTEETDSEPLAYHAFNEQLVQTTQLVKQLSDQLNELKEKVSWSTSMLDMSSTKQLNAGIVCSYKN